VTDIDVGFSLSPVSLLSSEFGKSSLCWLDTDGAALKARAVALFRYRG
jgi:hypothetical protein